MVRCLAGSLAMVTCKEPLRSALAQHLRQLLQVGRCMLARVCSWRSLPAVSKGVWGGCGKVALGRSPGAVMAASACHVLNEVDDWS